MGRGALGLAAAVGVALTGCKAPPRSGLSVAAASDLAVVLPELVAEFTRETGAPVTVTLGSSGLLGRQLAQGAPFDVFLSADTALVDAAAAQGHCDGATARTYARGRLVVVGAAVTPALDLSAALSDPRVQRLALANPAHAPYGRAALQALGRAGLAQGLRDRLVYADNVQQALRFVDSGNADVGLVAKSLVVARDGGARTFLDVSQSLHEPLQQAAVVCGHAPPAAARAFVDALLRPAAQAALALHGFEPAEAAR